MMSPDFDLPTASPTNAGLETSTPLFSMAYLRALASARSDVDLFCVARARLESLGALPRQRDEAAGKDAARSAELRLVGNAEFTRDVRSAVSRYNESVATAPNQSTELPLALANRSAAYQLLGRHKAALADMQRALEAGYPEHLKAKLYQRQAEVYRSLGRPREVAASLQEALNFLPLAKSPRVDKLETLTAALKSVVETVSSVGNADHTSREEETSPRKTYGDSREIPAASDCLRIEHNAEIGRHIVSTRDIRPGDILAIEKPYASVLAPESFTTHCYHCLKRRDAMVPCQGCTLVMFCSEACRSTAWQQFHRVECPVLGPVIRLNMEHEIKLLALRTLLVAVTEHGGLKGLRGAVLALDGDEDPAEHRTQGYAALHRLERHPHKASAPLLGLFAMTAAHIVTHLALNTDLYAGLGGTDTDWAAFTGGLLVRYMRIAQFNSFRVDESHGGGGLRGQHYGGGIYSLMSLFNHACWPNAARFYCDGDTQVLYAQLPIKKEEQILISYAGDFRKTSLADRRCMQEDSFYFTCRCVACVEDWPRYRCLSAQHPVFLCVGCRRALKPRGKRAKTVRCERCNRRQSVPSLDASFARLQEITTEVGAVARPAADVTARLVTLLGELYDSVAMPYLPIVECQELINKSFYRTMGNFYVL